MLFCRERQRNAPKCKTHVQSHKRSLRPRSDLVPVPGHRVMGTKIMDASDTPVLWTKNVHKQLGKGIYYWEIGDKFEVGASTACKKKSEYSGH